jgi:hypothetical protein
MRTHCREHGMSKFHCGDFPGCMCPSFDGAGHSLGTPLDAVKTVHNMSGVRLLLGIHSRCFTITSVQIIRRSAL